MSRRQQNEKEYLSSSYKFSLSSVNFFVISETLNPRKSEMRKPTFLGFSFSFVEYYKTASGGKEENLD